MGHITKLFEEFKLTEYKTKLRDTLQPVRNLIDELKKKLEIDKEKKFIGSYVFKITIVGSIKNRIYFDANNLELDLEKNNILLNVLYKEEETEPTLKLTLTIYDPMYDAKNGILNKYGKYFDISSARDILSFVKTYTLKIYDKPQEEIGWLAKSKEAKRINRFGMN